MSGFLTILGHAIPQRLHPFKYIARHRIPDARGRGFGV